MLDITLLILLYHSISFQLEVGHSGGLGVHVQQPVVMGIRSVTECAMMQMPVAWERAVKDRIMI